MPIFFWAISIFFFAAGAFASDCSFEKFRPQFLAERMAYEFRQEGIGQIDTRSTDARNIMLVRSTLVRDTGALGSVEFNKDLKGLSAALIVRDIRGQELFKVVEEKRGVSRTEIEFFSSLQRMNQFPFLTILHFPGNGTFHYVGAKDEGITTFYSLFQEAWNQAKKTILGETAPEYYSFKSPQENFWFRVQADPFVSPYRAYLAVSSVGNRFLVSGVVPSNYVYGAVMKIALEEFGPSTRDNLTIDERIRIMDLPPVCRNIDP